MWEVWAWDGHKIQGKLLKKYKKKETLYAIDAKKPSDSYFTITGTATGIAITGDDKKNPIYLPKIAVKELTRALFDFF